MPVRKTISVGLLSILAVAGVTPMAAQGGSNQGSYATHFRPPLIVGRVTDSKGNSVQGARVTTLDGHAATTDSAGSYRLSVDAPGTYFVVVESALGAAQGRVEVAAGTTTTLDFSLVTSLSFPFYQAQGRDYTGFAVSNFSDQVAALRITAYLADGRLMPFPGNPANLQVAPGNQIARLGSEIFGVDPQTPQSGWVELTSDNPGIGSFFLSGSDVRLDGSVAADRYAQKLVFTRVHQGPTAFRLGPATTYIGLANPSETTAHIRLRLVGPQTLESRATLPGHGSLYRSIAEIFSTSLDVADAYLVAEVTEGDGVAGVSFLEFGGPNTIVALNAQVADDSVESYSAQMANGEVVPGASFFTELSLVNTSPQTRRVTVQVIAEDGRSLADPVSFQIAAAGRFRGDVGALFSLGSSTGAPIQVGSIRVLADGAGVIGDVVFGDPVSLNFAAALPLQTRGLRQAVFSQVANAAGFFTGLALYNPNSDGADVTVEVYSEEGVRTGTTGFHLGGGNRISKLLVELVPATTGQLRGYILIRSTRPLIAQQLFGDNGGSFLSAVPPTIIQ